MPDAVRDAPPLLLLLGCSQLAKPLKALGLRTASMRSLRSLLEPKEGLEARAIVLGPAGGLSSQLLGAIPDLRVTWPLVDVIVWWPRASGSATREALKAGASDVLLTRSVPRCAREIRDVIAAQQLLPRAARLGDESAQPAMFEGMIARSRAMWNLFDTATQVAGTDATVLVLGETGTGKELLARAIHARSQREGRFVGLNCGAVTEELIDSELFGHERGSFTGATQDKEGLFRHADGGTLMLDEIGNVPLTAQYRLLRALQEGAVRPVGGAGEVSVDVRVIAATSASLEEDVRRGRFREDLFYRLDVIRLEIPPLRERHEDIVYLFAHFARQFAEQYRVTRPDLADDFLDALVGYEWPGNVRQLENFTERLVLTHANKTVSAEHLGRLLPFGEGRSRRRSPYSRTGQPAPRPGLPPIDTRKQLDANLEPRVEELERRYLDAMLRETRGKVGETARRAGISRRTLLRKLKRYGLDKMAYRSPAP